MHESLTVLLMILTPVGVVPNGHKDNHAGYPVYGWREAGYHVSVDACEKAANKMYAVQKSIGDKVAASPHGTVKAADAVRLGAVAHLCGNDSKPLVKK